MKRVLLTALLGVGACCLAGCGQNAAESSEVQETTAAVTTTAVTTTATTTAAATTVTTTTQAQYLLAENIELNIDAGSVRATSCTFTVTNQGEDNQPYSKCWRLLDPGTEKELKLLADAEELSDKAAGVLAPEGSAEIQADWEKRYGALPDGTYLLELVLEQIAEEQNAESSDAEKEQRIIPKIARAELVIDSEGFVPRVSIDPATVRPEGCVLTIRNSPDIGRTYTLVYRLYDESGTKPVELLKELDLESKLAKNYYMEPGGTLQITYNWSDSYGSLLEGSYAVEIDLLPDDGTPATSYLAPFVIE